jgi:hypothetical protein
MMLTILDTERLMKDRYEEHLRDAQERRMLKAVGLNTRVSNWIQGMFKWRAEALKEIPCSCPTP